MLHKRLITLFTLVLFVALVVAISGCAKKEETKTEEVDTTVATMEQPLEEAPAAEAAAPVDTTTPAETGH